MNTDVWRPKGPFVVVEPGVEWLKMAVCRPSRSKCVVQALHVSRIESAAGISPNDLAAALKAVKGGGLPVLAYLPRQTATIRLMELPSTDAGEIADMVDLQAARQTPYTRDEIARDYRVIGCPREGYTAVMLALAQRAVLRQRFYLFEEAGMEIGRMSVASEGLLSWYVRGIAQAGNGGRTMVLDVDWGATEMMLFEGTRPVFMRNLLLGTSQLLSDPRVWKEKFLEEIRRSLEAYRSEQPSYMPERAVVTGGAAAVPGLADDLRGALGVPAEFVDSMKPASGGADAAAAAAARGVSVAALIGFGIAPEDAQFSFAPETFVMRKELVGKARGLTILTSLVMACMVSASAFGMLNLFGRTHRLRLMESELAALEPEVKRVEAMLEVSRAAQARMKPRNASVRAAGEAHRAAAAAGVMLDSMSFDMREGRAQMEGSGGSWQDVRNFVGNLEQSPCFRNAREEGSSALDPKTGRYRFRVSCGLEIRDAE